ncbi:MAG: hypothetical protein JW384_03616 [Nitrosomonadaceae bacterium]|nr:hypothetical protein [Nitrosomonadaceae bacterium]
MLEKQCKTFYVEGIHCAACEFYLEETLGAVDGVQRVKADLAKSTVIVEGDLDMQGEALASKFTALVADRGYTLKTEATAAQKSHREFIIALPVAVLLIVGFVLLQDVGFVNLVTTDSVSYGTAALIGAIASVSTCLAIVGGLVLSLGASTAKAHGKWQSQAMFHVGRLAGFFLLGGLIGMLGKFFELGVVGDVALNILVALVMLILGLNLLDTFPALRKYQLKMPKIFAKHTSRASNSSHVLTPLLVGIATFFLPCGFTQSMQVYTLTTGSFLTGGLTMFFFALGTLPVLALLSFSSFEISRKPWKGIFFKSAGLVVIALALFNLWNGLVVLGLAPNLYSL